jgi:hypothetical protein
MRDNPFCNYFASPTDRERDLLKITDPEIVIGCKNRQGDGPLFFFVPVHGGAVRAGVCPEHAALLKQHHGTAAAS